jgi:hypothetical protein
MRRGAVISNSPSFFWRMIELMTRLKTGPHSSDGVQMMTDHAQRESVKRYACVQLDAKRRLMEGK